MEPDFYFVQIAALSVEIAKLESEISSDRAALNRDTLSGTNRIIISQGIDNKIRELDSMRQKLVSLELASINSYSQQFNKNIGALNESIKSLKSLTDNAMTSLNSTTQKLLKSSTRLEYFTNVLIIVAIASIAVSLLPTAPLYALIIAGVATYALILLFNRVLKTRKQLNVSSEATPA